MNYIDYIQAQNFIKLTDQKLPCSSSVNVFNVHAEIDGQTNTATDS